MFLRTCFPQASTPCTRTFLFKLESVEEVLSPPNQGVLNELEKKIDLPKSPGLNGFHSTAALTQEPLVSYRKRPAEILEEI